MAILLVSWVGFAGVKLDASPALLHGPALVRVLFVSYPQLTAINPLI
jgi:hypothetical protein